MSQANYSLEAHKSKNITCTGKYLHVLSATSEFELTVDGAVIPLDRFDILEIDGVGGSAEIQNLSNVRNEIKLLFANSKIHKYRAIDIAGTASVAIADGSVFTLDNESINTRMHADDITALAVAIARESEKIKAVES